MSSKSGLVKSDLNPLIILKKKETISIWKQFKKADGKH